jgi:methyl-accepting chemotaxis protein
MLKRSQGAIESRVLRGEPAKQQYGPGSADEQAQDDLDRRALKGEEIAVIQDNGKGRVLTVITPFSATANTRGVNCLGCHEVPSGSIIGAVRLSYSLAEVDAEISREMWWGIAISIVLLILGLVCLNIFLSRVVFKPLEALNESLKDIAEGEGDLTRRVEVSSNDEVGQLGSSFNAFVKKTQNTIKAIGNNAQTLAGASEELTAVSQQMGANAEETSTQSAVVSAASEEISKNVQTVASGVEELSATTREIAGNASEAAKMASTAVKSADDANTTVTKLHASSLEISAIVSTINSVAEQTKLLALNATIEAARAGDAGKGFAVVANEVKDLAMETAKASEDIRHKIEVIQEDTQGAVEVIAQINKIISKIDEFQSTIAATVEEQSAATNEIAQNIAEAARGSTEIMHNISSVAEAAHSTATGASDSQAASTELATMAAELQRLVQEFKV